MGGKTKIKLSAKSIIYISAAVILMFCLAFFAGYKIRYHQTKNAAINQEKNLIEPKPEKEKDETVNSDSLYTEIIISSTGDSTLGTDEKFGYNQSLPQVLAKNNNDLNYFYSNVKHIFKADDITTTNLETTFTDATQKAVKEFTFKGPAEYAKALGLGGIEAVNISNNHIYDYLQKGFDDTKAALEAADIEYFGEGNSLVKEVKGIRIGFLGYRGVSTDKAFLDKLKNDIQKLRSKSEFIIINFHWGEERKYSPNEIQKQVGRYAIDQGADLIIGHHPHVIQGVEKYKGKIIAYSLANFAFGGNKNPSDKDTFILQVKLKFTQKELKSYEVKAIPASVSSVSNSNDYRPTLLEGAKKEALLTKLNKLSFNLGFKINDEFSKVVDENLK